MDITKRNPNPNRLNIYVCDDCGLHIVTKDVVEGTTPFMIGCQCTPKCQGRMVSSMYRVFDPNGKMFWTHEWYKPTVILATMTPAIADHVSKGGLLLRRRIDNPQGHDVPGFTHIHVKRQTRYRVIGDVRLQLSRPELVDVGAFDHAGALKQIDGQLWQLYQGEDGVYSARHPEEFNDGRFQPIEAVS
jgi:hypothetical protein